MGSNAGKGRMERGLRVVADGWRGRWEMGRAEGVVMCKGFVIIRSVAGVFSVVFL